MGIFDSIKKKAQDLGIDSGTLDSVSMGGVSIGDIRKVVSEVSQVKDAISEFRTSSNPTDKPANPVANTASFHLTAAELLENMSDLPEAHNAEVNTSTEETEVYFTPARNAAGAPVIDPFMSARLDHDMLTVHAGYIFSPYKDDTIINLPTRMLARAASLLKNQIGGDAVPCTSSRKAMVCSHVPLDSIEDSRALWKLLYNTFVDLHNVMAKAKDLYLDSIGCGPVRESHAEKHAPAAERPIPFTPTIQNTKEILDELAHGDKVKTELPYLFLSGKSTLTANGDELLSPSVTVKIDGDEITISTGYYLNKKFNGEYISVERSFVESEGAKLARFMGDGYKTHYITSKPSAMKVIPFARITDRAALKKELQYARDMLMGILPEANDRYIDHVNECIRADREKSLREKERMSDIRSMLSAARDVVTEEQRRRKEEAAAEERRRAEAAAEQRRRKEDEAAEERRRGLKAGFTYRLRPEGTIRKLQEAFTEDYPYLRIGIYMVKTGEEAKRYGGTISSYDSDTCFGDIRSFKGECTLEINGNDTPKELELYFRKNSGLVIKICYNDENDKRYYISADDDEYNEYIYDINRKFRDEGYERADIS